MPVAADPVYVVGNTHSLELLAQRDGVNWNLLATPATVTVILVDPSGVENVYPATLVGVPTNLARYLTRTAAQAGGTADLYVNGDWRVWWRIIDGTIDMKIGPFVISVDPYP